MRDVSRIEPFLKEVGEIWEDLPDWRFGQLMVNFICAYGDPFYWEEDRFIKELRSFVNEYK